MIACGSVEEFLGILSIKCTFFIEYHLVPGTERPSFIFCETYFTSLNFDSYTNHYKLKNILSLHRYITIVKTDPPLLNQSNDGQCLSSQGIKSGQYINSLRFSALFCNVMYKRYIKDIKGRHL